MKNRGCKGCSDSYKVTEEQIQRILAAPMFQYPVSVSDDVYEARLSECSACPKLMDGTTCLVCGCIVRVAAKYRNRSCPNANDRRWHAEEAAEA
ncbi:DUF6171 family protein [Paenibacillus sp. NEAU-GSW1]|uniref:DUF6171 family protein n=1 Tax=Paenibacillus sp. NEAU-GSW1 TaxID=2682486 RepID=UPI0012E2C097|nr:DUF6171 family protein [Paenibacillus sp. NEAU-GSW1]MUT66904.1 hypothetical protein [Paenibacillus sp. NEAU-GSW1]